LAHVLRCCTAHDGTEPRLELPGALSGSDYERAAPEPRHAGLEGGERAQRWIEEKEPQDPAGERMRLGTRLQAARQLEQRQHFLALEVGEIEEALHASSHRLTSTPTPSRHSFASRHRDVPRRRRWRSLEQKTALSRFGVA